VTALAGLAIAILLWWLLNSFGRSSPGQVVRFGKMVGGVAALGVAGLLALRGRLDMAALAGGAGAWLLGWSAVPPGWLPARWSGSRSDAAASRLRSPMIEIALDGRTGTVSGVVLAGEFAGRALETLAPAELLRLREVCLACDVEGARLVEAYLDRGSPGWGEHAEGDAHRSRRPDLQRGTMTEQEAYEILGLQPGAGPDLVRAAHRALIKKLHPDQGGSTYLASRVNQAKDFLLHRHR
jgi:hypothetical protein